MPSIVLQPRGPAGFEGYSVLSANPPRDPVRGDGKDGDFWVNQRTGGFFQRSSNAWRLLFSLIGTKGNTGLTGPPGKQIIYGPAAPGPLAGVDGDFYLQTAGAGAPLLFGPKDLGSWPAGVSLLGRGIITGSGAPSSGDGLDGDLYYQTSGAGAPLIYGPKTAGTWGSSTSLVGPAPFGVPAPWATATDYTATAPASAVTYLGSSYFCTTAHTSGGSFDPTKWQIIAQKGADGAGNGNVNPSGTPVVVGHGVAFGATDGNTIVSTGFPLTRGYITGLGYGDLTLGF